MNSLQLVRDRAGTVEKSVYGCAEKNTLRCLHSLVLCQLAANEPVFSCLNMAGVISPTLFLQTQSGSLTIILHRGTHATRAATANETIQTTDPSIINNQMAKRLMILNMSSLYFTFIRQDGLH